MHKVTTETHFVAGMHRRGKLSLSMAVGGPALLLLAIMILIAGGSRLLAARASARWPGTEGLIIESRARSNCTLCRPTINYYYTVRSQSFVGNNITAGPQDYYNHDQADLKVRSYVVGRKLTVYYDPKEPAVSCLEPGILRWYAYLYFAVAGVVMTAGLFLLWLLYPNESIFPQHIRTRHR
jgi:Protein of unknown function (DUF3592)